MKKLISLILVVTMVFAAVPAALAESVGGALSSAGAAVLDAYKAVVNADGEFSLPLLESYTTCTMKTGVKDMDGFTDRPYAISWEGGDEGYRSGIISFDARDLTTDATKATLKLNVSRTQGVNESGIASTISVYAVDPEKVNKDNSVKPDDPDASTKMGTISLAGLPNTEEEITKNNEVSVEINILRYRELYPNAKTIALMLSNRGDIADSSSYGLVGFYGKDADEDYRPRLTVSLSDINIDPSKVAEVTVKTVLSDGTDSGVADIKIKVLAGQEYTYVQKSNSLVVVDGTFYTYNEKKSTLTITPKSEGENVITLYYEKVETEEPVNSETISGPLMAHMGQRQTGYMLKNTYTGLVSIDFDLKINEISDCVIAFSSYREVYSSESISIQTTNGITLVNGSGNQILNDKIVLVEGNSVDFNSTYHFHITSDIPNHTWDCELSENGKVLQIVRGLGYRFNQEQITRVNIVCNGGYDGAGYTDDILVSNLTVFGESVWPHSVGSGSFGAEGDNLEWDLRSDGLLTISGIGAMTDWSGSDELPWLLEGVHTAVNKVIIEEGVTSIGEYAFADCRSLMEVSIPSSVQTIGYRAFSECVALKELTVLKGVTSIGEYAFDGCTSLTLYVYPDSYAETYAIENDILYEILISENCRLTVKVTDEKGALLTGGYTVNWYDGSGAPVADGDTLTVTDKTKKYEYEIILDETLGKSFIQPPRTSVGDISGDKTFTVALEKFSKAELGGRITDGGAPISGAAVRVEQTLNGKFPVYFETVSGGDGSFEVEVYCLPAKITLSAEGFYDRAEAVTVPAGGLDMGALALTALPASRLRLNLTLRGSAAAGVTGGLTALEGFSGLDFTLTGPDGRDIPYTAQYPDLVIDNRLVKEGDTLRLRVESATTAPAEAEVVLGVGGSGSCALELTENGRLSLTPNGTGMAAVMIFGGDGTLAARGLASAAYKSEPLPDGGYSVVVLKDTGLLRSAPDLNAFESYGLSRGNDYVLLRANIAAGVITELGKIDVPDFDESLLYYTVPGGALCAAGSSSSVAGKLISITARYEIDGKYSTSDERLTFEIPEGMAFIDGSLLLNGDYAVYSANEGRLTVVTGAPSGTVKFYVSAERAGDYAVDARLSFGLDGRTVTQPLGAARVAVTNMTLTAPEKTSRDKVTVSGSALPKSEVTVYVNDEAVTTAAANSNGSWWAEVELKDHYLLQYYQIRAEATNLYGVTANSDTVGLWYDANYPRVSKVTMYNTAHSSGSFTPTEFETVFDFINPSPVSHSYNMWPGQYVDFTFKIELLRAADSVTLYVYTKGGNTYAYDAQYDPETDLWLVAAKFDNFDDAPVSVGVDCNPESVNYVVSREEINDLMTVYEEEIKINTEHLETVSSELDDLAEKFDINGDYESNKEVMDKYLEKNKEYYKILTGEELESDYDSELPDLESMSKEEVSAYLDSIQEKLNLSFASVDDAIQEYESQILDTGFEYDTKTCSGLTPDGLLEDGFETIDDSVGNKIYYKSDSNEYQMVDFASDIYVTISINDPELAEIMSIPAELMALNDVSLMVSQEQICEICDKIADYGGVILDWIGKAKDLISNLAELFPAKKLSDAIKETDRAINEYGRVMEGGWGDDVFDDTMGKCMKAIDENAKYRVKFNASPAHERLLVNTSNTLERWIGKGVGRAMAVLGLLLDIVEYGPKLLELFRSFPENCVCTKELADSIRMEIYTTLTSIFSYLGVSLATTVAEFLTVTINPILALTILGLQILAAIKFSEITDNAINSIREARSTIGSICDDSYCGMNGCDCNMKDDNQPDPNPGPGEPGEPYPGPGEPREPYPGVHANPIWDPSGYVCEAVPSNRVEGVTATAYYEDDVLDNFGEPTGDKTPAVWDAEDFDQTNPLITDANGAYAWDVPEGSWAVKFEKDGYETAWSDWLPVPPPQTEVNVALVSTEAPAVESVSAFGDKVRLVFTQYMDILSVNNETVKVNVGGTEVAGTVTPVDAEASFDDPNVEYARTFVFTPDSEISGTAFVTVSGAVNYAGRVMDNRYAKNSTVVIEPKDIEVPESVEVAYGSGALVEVQLLPGAAGAGHTVRAVSSSPSVVSVVNGTAVTDENGRANIMLAGNLPGGGEITVTVDGTDISAVVKAGVAGVVIPERPKAAKVKASVPGGTVLKGERVELSTDTDGAEIYYTLDNTDPVSSASRIKYTGPIEITDDTLIIAYAVKNGYEDSPTVGFAYTVKKDNILLNVDGWTDTDITLIAAIYTAENKMIDCKSFNPSGTGHDEVVFELDGEEVAFSKVFEWSSLKDMTPMGKVTIYNI